MTERVTKQIVMDYEDFSQALEDMADKILARLKEAAPAQGAEDSSLLTAKEVRAFIGVTDKTLHVWNKTGFLPRLRIGGVVRYSRADVERVAQVKGKK